MRSVGEIVRTAAQSGRVLPAFNIPYLPMMAPVVQAVVDAKSFALIETARLEWLKFESRGPAAVAEEYARWAQPEFVRLHLDHVPAIDEDNQVVDYMPVFAEALALGYESVMIDGSRLPLAENIRVTAQVVQAAHAAGASVEAELGAVLGHEDGPIPPYEELFASGKGFTDPEEARRFVRETGCDWLSVAVGNIHGAVAAGRKDQKKIAARLNLEHLSKLAQITQVPLVLHGGSGVLKEYVLGAVKRGVAKINVGTEIRQPYEVTLRQTGSVPRAQEAVYERTRWVLRDYLGIEGSAVALCGGGEAK